MAVFTTLAATTALTATGVAIAGTAIYAAGIGIATSIKAGKASQAAAQRQEKAQQLQARRKRRAAIRQNILASARARASAQSAGTATSSGLQGGVGAGRSQLGAELGFGTQMSGLSSEISAFQGQAQKYSDISKLSFGVAKLAAGQFDLGSQLDLGTISKTT